MLFEHELCLLPAVLDALAEAFDLAGEVVGGGG